MGRWYRRRNPDLLGVDVETAVVTALMVGATETVTSKVVKPLLGGLVPGGATSNSFMAKLVDAGYTLGAGWLLAEATGMLHRPWVRPARFAAVMLAGAKGVSAVIPGVSLTGTIPSFSFPWMAQATPPPALPAASSDLNGTQVRRQLGSGTMGLL